MNDIEWDAPSKPKGDIEWDTPRETVGAIEAGLISGGNWLDRKAAGLRSAVQDYVPGGGAIVRGLDSVDRFMGVQTPNADRADIDRRMAPIREDHPVANFVGGFLPSALTVNPLAMGAMAALDPGTLTERGANAGLAYGFGKVGEWGGGQVNKLLANRSANKAASLEVAQAQNAVRDGTLKTAQEAGYVLPPSQVSPTLINRALEGFAGKLSTAQSAAQKNQTVTNNLVKREIGLAPEDPLTRESLVAMRAKAGEAYEVVKTTGTVTPGQGYNAALDDIVAPYKTAAKGFPNSAPNPIIAEIESLRSPSFDASSAVAKISELRESATAAYAKGDKQVGKAMKSAAKAIEDALDAHLRSIGAPAEVLTAYRAARTRIAKLHTVESAINPATGNVVASKLADLFNRGKPLTGGMLDVGRAAKAFPAATKEITTSMPGLSPLDYMGGMLTGGTLGPAGLAATFARPVVRSGILSKGYQKKMVNAPSYEMGLLDDLLGKTKVPGGLLGLAGLEAYQ